MTFLGPNLNHFAFFDINILVSSPYNYRVIQKSPYTENVVFICIKQFH